LSTNDVGNPGHGLGQRQKGGGIKPVNGIPTPPPMIPNKLNMWAVVAVIVC
jgi:hypothetical protein